MSGFHKYISKRITPVSDREPSRQLYEAHMTVKHDLGMSYKKLLKKIFTVGSPKHKVAMKNKINNQTIIAYVKNCPCDRKRLCRHYALCATGLVCRRFIHWTMRGNQA